MLGSVASSNDLGAIPCAISWLYKGINEKRQKSGARFSVRVSALGINATKPGSSGKDLLAALATGNYLNVEQFYLFLISLMTFYFPAALLLAFVPNGSAPVGKSGKLKIKSKSEKANSNRIK